MGSQSHIILSQESQLGRGQSYTFTFKADSIGSFRIFCDIFCAIHPLMQNGLLIVSEWGRPAPSACAFATALTRLRRSCEIKGFCFVRFVPQVFHFGWFVGSALFGRCGLNMRASPNRISKELNRE